MIWTNKAISYTRFSSKIQEKGDSVRRQTAGADGLCLRHGLILDTSLSFKDLATSAYSGANLKADLGAFLALLKEGKIPRGCTLIIEKLDRLSRQHPMQQLSLIDSILKAGVRIAKTDPDRFYTDDDIQSNPHVVYEILSHAMSGFMESEKKSQRCGAACGQKRKAAENGVILTKQCPGWLVVLGDKTDRKIVEIPDRVKLVQRIFGMADSGLGSPAIAKQLNSEGLTGFCGKGWQVSYLTKLLKDRRVLGEHQAHHGKANLTPAGSPILGYYPQIIDVDTFNRVQVGRQARRKNKQGREEQGIINIFRGLLFDAASGGAVGLFTYTDRRKGEVKKAARLIVRKGFDTGIGYDTSFRYEVFESAFFRFVSDLNPADFSSARAVDAERLATMSSELTLTSEKIDITKSKMKAAKDGKTFSVLQDGLADLEKEKERVKAEYDKLRMILSSPAVEGVADTQTLVTMMADSSDPDSLRLKIRTRLRQLVHEVWIFTYDEDRQRRAAVRVVFQDGTYRLFHTGYSLTSKPYTGTDSGTERIDNLTTASWRSTITNLGKRLPDSSLKNSSKPV